MSAALELRGVRKRFGGLQVLSDCSLRVEQGQLAGLIGPNGAGKTTVFNLVCGLLRPDSGEIHLLGERIDGLRPDAISARGLARTFQGSRVFAEMTVLDNVKVGLHRRFRYDLVSALGHLPRFRECERRIEMEARGLLESFGLGLHARKPAGSLPYGLQRMVELVRALAGSPRLLLLDEPAAGLSPGETEALLESLLRARSERGLTVLLIDHDVRLVMNLCNPVHVLYHGEIIASGEPSAVRAHPQVIEAYLGRRRERTRSGAAGSGEGAAR